MNEKELVNQQSPIIKAIQLAKFPIVIKFWTHELTWNNLQELTGIHDTCDYIHFIFIYQFFMLKILFFWESKKSGGCQ